MNLPSSLSTRAIRHIRHLVNQIGARPAGSASEREAHQYIAGQLAKWGYQVENMPVPFAPLPPVSWPYLAGAAAFIIAGWIVAQKPWLTVWLPIILASLPQTSRWLLRQRKREEISQNTYAFLKNSAHNASRLVIVAHADSAPASRFQQRYWLKLLGHSMDIAQRIAIALATLAAVAISGFQLPRWILVASGILGTIGGAWLAFFQLQGWISKTIRYSPGANDNASGVGVALALAEFFATKVPQKVQLGFLFTGAEETGMHGAEAFARQQQANNAGIHFLVLDMVGAGTTLRYITRSGILFPQRTSTKLNHLVQLARPEAREIWYTLRSGDFAAFLYRGFPATALQTSGSSEADLTSHTLCDNLDIIEHDALEMTSQTVIRMVHLLEHGKADISK